MDTNLQKWRTQPTVNSGFRVPYLRGNKKSKKSRKSK